LNYTNISGKEETAISLEKKGALIYPHMREKEGVSILHISQGEKVKRFLGKKEGGIAQIVGRVQGQKKQLLFSTREKKEGQNRY